MMDDSHFLLDNAPPKEVLYTLLSFSRGSEYSNSDLIDILNEKWSYKAQRNYSNSTRRLFDLQLLDKNEAGLFSITTLGEKVKEIHEFDNELFNEVFHFLHTTFYYFIENPRKMFWSYRKCSEYLWRNKKIITNQEISNHVINEIDSNWPNLDTSTRGGRFNEGGVSSWKTWVNSLVPNPIGDSGELVYRHTNRYELILLSIDDYYRKYKLRFGDPVVVGANVLDEISSVFFLDLECAKQLIIIASRLSPLLSKRDTYGGMAITLNEPYSIERI